MAEYLLQRHGRDRAPKARDRTGRQSKARSEQETASGFKREKRLFSAIQPCSPSFFNTANGLSGGSASRAGGSNVAPCLRG